jgi:hypothetical protein
LGAFVRQIITPRIEKLDIYFVSDRLTIPVAHLKQFINMAENFRFGSAKVVFEDWEVNVEAYPRGEAEVPILSIKTEYQHLDWQVSFAARISNLLSQMPSGVEHLALEYKVYGSSPEEDNEVDSTEWRKLLRSFRSVKTLRIDNGLVGELSRCLVDDGELPFELLPELQELTYSGDGDTGDPFTSFIDARHNAGRPITMVRRSPSPRSDSGASMSSLNPL